MAYVCNNCGQTEDDMDYFCPEWETTETAVWLVDNLEEALNEYCPPFIYFGTHPGDGADFGYWPDMDALEDALRYGEDTDDDETRYLPEDNVLVHVSDHGNVTVMDMDRQVLWSVV